MKTELLPDTFALSVFEKLFDTNPIPCTLSLEGLAATFQQFRDVPDKTALGLWSPTVYHPGQSRGKKGVASVTMLAFDFDDGTSIQTARQAFSKWWHVGHTSWSHDPAHHRFRVILPLRRPIAAGDWPLCWAAALRLWDHLTPGVKTGPDTKCKDAARIFYLPAKRAEIERFAWVNTMQLSLDLTPGPPGGRWWDEVRESIRPKPLPVTIRDRVCFVDAQSELQNRLARDPAMRERWADEVGAKVSDGWAMGAPCPRCARRSVWWPIDPAQRRSGACNHVNSCGWWGSISHISTAIR